MTILHPHSDIATGRERLAGQELLNFVNGNPTMNRVEMCQGAGYERQFTAFYEAILDARQANGEYQTIKTTGEYYEVNGRDWYEDILSDQGRELYDKIEDFCPEFSKLDAEQCQEFMDELSELGITTATQFEDAYWYQSSSWNAEADFAEYLTTDVECLDIPSFVVVDWKETWDRNLCCDFSTIEFDGMTYFFHNHF